MCSLRSGWLWWARCAPGLAGARAAHSLRGPTRGGRARRAASRIRRGARGGPHRLATVAPMQQRSVGATGLKVSRLGLGTMPGGRDTDEHEARDQLIAFAEAGGTLLDTAAGYGNGASEELVGSLLGDVVARDEVVIATKAGISRRTGTRVTDASRGSLLT